MKKALSFIMVMAMLLSMVPAVLADTTEGVVITSGTDVVASVAEPVTYTWTAEANGTLTVTMGATSPGWSYSIFDGAGNTVGLPKTGKTEKSADFKLVAGTTYTFEATGYNTSSWEPVTGPITYTLTFVADSGTEEVEKAEYEICETPLTLGDNNVTLLDTAVTTIYTFEPTETGIFTFTAPEGAILGYWGAGSWFLQDPGSTTNTYEWTCTGVGQTAHIGVSGVEGSFNLNVAKTGDYTVVEIPIVHYENKATLESFTLPEGATLHGYIDVTAETVHTAVLGDDGYYHFNSADGDIILVDMDYQDIILSAALQSDRPVMYAYTKDEDGNDVKYDIGDAIKEYEAVMDENGYYPLTEDLILFYDVYANGAGTYTFYVTSAYNEENVWMYCMRTVTFPDAEVSEPDETEPEVTEPEVTEPEVTEPEVTEPEVTEPEVSEPEASEPEETEPTKPAPNENVVFSVIHTDETTHYEYGSQLKEAINSAPNGSTIILYKDIDLGTGVLTVEAGQNLTLDLNGCTITTLKTSGATLNVSGNLIIQDTSAEGDGLIANTATSSDRAVLTSGSSAVLTIKSGNFSATTQAIRIDGGTLNMEGGTVTAKTYAIYVGASCIGNISGGTAIVTGSGSFVYPLYCSGSATVSVTGGYFNGPKLSGTSLVGKISGGYFTVSPTASYIADGYEIVDNDDAVYLFKVIDPNATTEPEEPVLGSAENPILIYNMGASIEATAGQTVYCQSFVGGMIMNITGEGDFKVVYNGTEYVSENGTLSTTAINGSMMMPVSFTLVNGDADATYTVSFAAPIGSMDNPDTLVMDYNYADIAAGSQGYYYTWTAEEAGILTISMPEDMGWTYTINNLTAGTYGDNQWSDSYPVVNPATVEVAAGDQLQIIVNTYDPADMWNNPAAELAIYASFTTLPGTEGNPIWFVDQNAETASIEDQMNVPAGATMYYTGRVGGLTMTVNAENISIVYEGNTYTPVNGVITIDVVNAGFFAPAPVFAETNTGSEAAVYDVVFSYALGSFENPAQLVMGENKADITGAGQGYYFIWTAAEDGKLTIEMTSSNWTYVINNNTQYGYGDNHASDDETVVASETVSVKAGDEIQIVIGTADYEAAEVTLNASFKNNQVAMIGDTVYETVADALAAAKNGETVKLVNDAEADYVVITPGVTLDLGSYSLTANYVIGLNGSFITAAAEGAEEGVAGGKLIVAKDNVSLSSAAVSADGNWKILPVWMDGYYAFAKAQVFNPTFTKDTEAGTAKLEFYATFNKYFKDNVFNDGCEDNQISIIISAVYTENGIKVTKEYYYTTPLVQDAMANLPLYATIADCDSFEGLELSISIIAASGVEVTSESFKY